MSEINRVELLGNLGKDPERRTVGDTCKLEFTMCTTEKFLRNGQQVEVSDWHNVEIWGQPVEWLAPVLKKGAKVHVLGSLKTQSWEKDGQKHYKTFVKAVRVLPIARNDSAPRTTSKPASQARQSDPTPGDYGAADPGNDDIPF
jgi:single-strand DNA-binding protein